MALGLKKVETRGWYTSYRGPLAIHAAKGFPRWAIELAHQEPFATALLTASITSLDQLPRGAVIAKVDMMGCYATPGHGVPWREYLGGFRLPPEEPERSFGDYGPGRYAWMLENAKPLPVPIPWRGALGLFNVELP